jgi:hypothetical protein
MFSLFRNFEILATKPLPFDVAAVSVIINAKLFLFPDVLRALQQMVDEYRFV